MAYNRNRYHRRTIRLAGYDYAIPGAYFVTICTWGRECILGDVTAKGEMGLNGLGRLARSEWEALLGRFPRLRLDDCVIMPNHLHAVVFLEAEAGGVAGKGEASDDSGAQMTAGAAADASPLRAHGTKPGSLGAIVQNFKSVSTRRLNKLRQTPGVPFWQRNYWEHVVRDESDLARIREYVQSNPAARAMDTLHPAAPGR